jgi:hypothetical protein
LGTGAKSGARLPVRSHRSTHVPAGCRCPAASCSGENSGRSGARRRVDPCPAPGSAPDLGDLAQTGRTAREAATADGGRRPTRRPRRPDPGGEVLQGAGRGSVARRRRSKRRRPSHA